MSTELPVGTEFVVEIDAFAHGGHCVGRHDGRVVFVRHALPGEQVVARVTEDKGGAFCRADAVTVLRAAPARVEPPCPYAHPDGCGGCDLQHVSPAGQRALKAGVVREQLVRLGELSQETADALLPAVEELPGGMLGWRTRVKFAIDEDGRAGLRKHRSHDVLPLERCAVATPAVEELGVTGRRWPGVAAVEAVVSGVGDRALVLEPPAGAELPPIAQLVPELQPAQAGAGPAGPTAGPSGPTAGPSGPTAGPSGPTAGPSGPTAGPSGPTAGPAVLAGDGRHPATALRGHHRVREDAGGRRWLVHAEGFWQVHPAAAQALTDAVLGALDPRPGERALDLYAGVGLFAGALGTAVGPQGRVIAVETDAGASADARRNLRDLPWVEVVHGRVDQTLAGARPDRRHGRRPPPAKGRRVEGPVDLVVLDPPRSGAGAAVVTAIAGRRPRAVAYVACDPAALARDVHTFAAAGYTLTGLRGFDAFPMTHHVECVALFTP